MKNKSFPKISRRKKKKAIPKNLTKTK